MKLAIALLLLSGCLPYGAEPIPGSQRGYQDSGAVEPPPVATTALALSAFAGEWEATFGDHAAVAEVVNNVRVHWVRSQDIPGYSGLTDDAYDVRVVFVAKGVAHTALAHELVHVMLWHTAGDPDADHALGKGPWHAEHDAMIQRAEFHLQAMGL